MGCDQVRQLHAYHDGELAGDERAAFEQHLRGCAACTRELEELRTLSLAFAGMLRPEVPADTLERLHDGVESWQQRSVLRLAEALTAAAAAILFVGLIGLFAGRSSSANAAAAGPPAQWEQVALTLQVDPTAQASADPETRIAQWINTELTSQQGGND